MLHIKAIEDTVKAVAAAVAAKDTSVELSDLIKLDSDNKNNSDDNTYAAFENTNNIKAIGVEDKGDSVLN